VEEVQNMRLKKSFIAGAVLSFVCRVALSQLIIGPATFTPNPPTSAGPIQATYILRSGGCVATSTTSVIGTVVRTTVTVGGCFFGPPTFDNPVVSGFGPLPAGTYTYEIYALYPDGSPPQFISSQPLVVSAPIPALSMAALIALFFALLGVATIELKR
jgi:hypothetical protein